MSDDLVCEHCCHPPTFKHREAQQHPYRPLWQAMIDRIANLSPDMPIYKRDLDRWAVELWNDVPDAKEVFALRTTRYGRDDTD